MDRWGETGRWSRCFARISAAVSWDADCVAASLIVVSTGLEGTDMLSAKCCDAGEKNSRVVAEDDYSDSSPHLYVFSMRRES